MGQLVFQAALGGQVNLVGPNTASTFNLNVPAATDTLVGRATTDTLTNKTLTSPVVSGGTIDNAVIGGTTAVAGSFTTVTAGTSVTAPFLTSAASTSLLLKSAGTTAVTIDTSQNVGIGTSSPTALRTKNLEVSSSGTNDSSAVIVSKNGTGISTLRLGTSGGASGFDINFNFPNTGMLGFYDLAAGATRVAIDSSGNLLVGGITVRDTCKFTLDTSNNGIEVYVVPNTNACDFAIFRANAGALCGNISRVGTTNAVTYASASDYRLKENVAPMIGALSSLARLKPVTYTWKDGGASADGFIAHELAEVCPSAVVGEKDEVDINGNPKYQSVDTSFLVATLTAAIQEQQALITQLQADVSALKALK